MTWDEIREQAQPWSPDLCPDLDSALTAALGESPTPASVSVGLDLMQGQVDTLATNCGRQLGFACAKGCSYCCWVQVAASVPEVLTIAAQIKQMLRPERRRLENAVRHAQERTRAKTYLERAGQRACPLLVEGCCAVYPARPSVCRRCHSLSREECARNFANGQPTARQTAFLLHAGGAIAETFELALAERGLKPRMVELVAGLGVALDLGVSRAWDRYLSGGDEFLAAVPAGSEAAEVMPGGSPATAGAPRPNDRPARAGRARASERPMG